VRNNEEKMNVSEYTTVKADGILVAKANGVPGYEWRNSMKTWFKTGANSASPKAILLQERYSK